MANSEDPPYLTVGTEVSAKYRGAFCEATIKTAKKLVKCKVNYGKGQSAVVTSDFIKGTLKVGGQVEVRQTDGQFQTATIAKLTDQSTYTVVFDDGDERTLKRSSLCLKGGRHFHESESLDHLPLTDPENFGTPVMNSSSKKTGRKRRRGSHSPSSSSGPASKRGCSYPSQFPVGKAVFLENDRRRSSWLPAVIVPAHYVLEDSEMSPDTICLRSFKDGRYFAATKKELHEFSPDKEPLLSMLEGEIQAMYMCKPAIERAMAYIDTGELPWDMDLFDRSSNSERPAPSHLLGSDPSTSDDDDPKDESASEEAKKFETELRQFHESRGTPMQQKPTIVQQELNLYQLYRLVKAIGGMERVTQEMKWRSLYLQLGLPLNSSASYALRQAYRKHLYQFELYEKNKAKGSSGGWSKKAKPHPPPSSDEEQDSKQQDQSNQLQDRTRQQDRTKRLKQQDRVKQEGSGGGEEKSSHGGSGTDSPAEKVNGLEKSRKVVLSEQKTVKTVKVEKLAVKPLPVKLEEEEDRACGSDSKSEGSDMECTPAPGLGEGVWRREGVGSQGDCSSSLSTGSLVDRGEFHIAEGETEGLEHCADGYKEGDRVLVLYGKGKALRTYEAKVKEVEKSEERCDYLVHYSGWNSRYDEWIDSNRIAGKITGESKPRPHFNSKRKKTAKSASSSTLFKRSKLPPGTLSSSNQLILSPSLQAIISSHTHPQQPKPPKKENSRSHDGISGKSICVKEFSSKTPITLVTKNISPKGLSRGPISLVPCRPPTDKPLGKMEASTSSKERVGEGVDIVKELTAEASSGSKGPSRGALASKLQSQGPGQVKEPAAESSSKTLSKALAEDPVKGAGKASETTSKGPPETKPSNKGAEVNKSQVKGSESNKTQVKGSESNKTQVKGSETTKTPVKGSETTKTPVKGSEATKTPVKGTDMKGKVLEKSESSSKKSCMEKKTPGKESPIENKGLTRSRAGKAMDRSKNKTTLESGSDGITSPAAASDSGKQQPSPGSPSSSEETSSPERSDRDHHQKTSPFQQQQQQLQQDEKKVWRSSPPSHGISPPSLPSVASALLCSETLPGLLPKHHSSPPTSSVSSATAATTPTAATAATALSALAEPAAHSLLSLSVSAGPFVPPPTTAPSPSTNKPELPSQQQEKKLDSVDSSSTSSSGINSMDGLECGEEHKCLDSASDGEGSPSPTHHHAPCNTSKPLASNSPDSKRKWRTETVEEYQCRKKARHADMNYTLDFSQLPPMSSVERVSLIQQRLRDVQHRWTDLKAEVAYIERKRRRAKRKEREAAQHQNHPPPPQPPSACSPSIDHTPDSTPSDSDSQLHSVISCH